MMGNFLRAVGAVLTVALLSGFSAYIWYVIICAVLAHARF